MEIFINNQSEKLLNNADTWIKTLNSKGKLKQPQNKEIDKTSTEILSK